MRGRAGPWLLRRTGSRACLGPVTTDLLRKEKTCKSFFTGFFFDSDVALSWYLSFQKNTKTRYIVAFAE